MFVEKGVTKNVNGEKECLKILSSISIGNTKF